MTKLIVEICQNHKGDRKILSEMIHAAKDAGADIVKGQIIFSEDLVPRDRFEEGVIESNGVRKAIKRSYQPERERLSQIDLAGDDYRFFVEEANRVGITPMMTVFSRGRIDFAADLPWKERLVKVASYDCGSHQMIHELAGAFDRLIVSTGATFDEEIVETARILRESGKPYAMLHCVTSYPNTLQMCNMARMEWLKQFAPEVGWSDHTFVERDGIKAAKVAIMLGADFIERHFTILPASETKDGPVSITPEMARELAGFARFPREDQKKIVEREIPEWRIMIGHPTREMTHTEMLNRDYYRGRFASRVGNEWVQNWEERDIRNS